MIAAINSTSSKIGETEFSLYDSKRNRPLWTYVWYPCENGIDRVSTALFQEPKVVFRASLLSREQKYPLIVLSHGSSGDAKDQIWLVEHLVKSGNIVISIDHYGNNWKKKIPEIYFNFWERAKDISFVLDHTLSTSEFKDVIDQDRIGFAGYSLGGMAGIWLAGGMISESLVPSLDEIKAFFLMAPRSEEFSKQSTAAIKLPFFIVFGDSDEYIPMVPNGEMLMEKFPLAKFHIFKNGTGHYTFV